MDSTGILFLAGIIIVLVIGVLLLGFWGLGKMFGRASRFDALAEYYSVTPRKTVFEKSALWHTIKIGTVDWRKWVNLAVTPRGFYLEIKFGFKRYAFFIPWNALHNPQETRLYWRPAVELRIGDPAIVRMVVYMEVYRKMEPFLEKARSLTLKRVD